MNAAGEACARSRITPSATSSSTSARPSRDRPAVLGRAVGERVAAVPRQPGHADPELPERLRRPGLVAELLDALERQHQADPLTAHDAVEVGGRPHLEHAVGVLADGPQETGRLAERLAQRALRLALELDEDRAHLQSDAAGLEQGQPGAREGAVARRAGARDSRARAAGRGVRPRSRRESRGGSGAGTACACTIRELHAWILTSAIRVKFVRWPYKTRPGLTESTLTSPVSENTRMSFERAHSATSRADQTTVRRANLGVVLQQIAAGEPRSRARVAAETGLTRGTVSSLVGELIELDLLRETGEDEHFGAGRPAGADARARRPRRRDRARGQRRLPRRLRRGPDRRGPLRAPRAHRQPALARRPRAGPAGAHGRAGPRRDRRGGSRPGRRRRCAARPRRGADGDAACARPNLGWSEIPVADELAARLAGLAVRADNEANLAALAEHWQGVARDLENFICVFGEVGVGGGIFVDGELFRGAHGFGGEFGHITVDPDGPALQVRLGRLPRDVRRAGGDRARGPASRSAPAGGRAASRAELVRRAGEGDETVLESLAEAGRYLGIGLASAVNLFDVDVVVLGGCFGPLAPWLVDDVRGVLASACSRPRGRAARCVRRSSARAPPSAARPR